MLRPMAKLIYSTIASLDGYNADEDGNFDWAEPDEEVHRFVNDLERPVGTYLMGRRMYEVMVYWETADTVAGQPDHMLDYARVWQAADKVVYSRTLETTSSARTRIERDFDPEAVRQLKESAALEVTIPPRTLVKPTTTPARTSTPWSWPGPSGPGSGTRWWRSSPPAAPR